MRTSHTNPEEALLAARDLRAKRLIPMHYGTFDLSDEPLGEPEQRLRKIAGPEEVTFLTIGEKFPLLDKGEYLEAV
jgi:L-ascorbate metabolism protein UlaG (beta-lactamase superfamily)